MKKSFAAMMVFGVILANSITASSEFRMPGTGQTEEKCFKRDGSSEGFRWTRNGTSSEWNNGSMPEAKWDRGYKSEMKKQRHWVIVIDGMSKGTTFLGMPIKWPDMPSMYLYEAIPRNWREESTKRNLFITPFTWSRDTHKTSDAVENLYLKIKSLSTNSESIGILAHSWGTVLAYAVLKKHPDVRIDKLITLGSPLNSDDPLVEMHTKARLEEIGITQITRLDNLTVWHNYYNVCDIFGSSIPFLSEGSNVMLKNFYPFPSKCHSCYFENQTQWEKILADCLK